MRALRPVFIFLTGIIFSSCLLDLDTFVTPVVFKPETIPIDQPFEFGDFTGGELSEDVNAIYPDDTISNKQVVTFTSEGNTLYGVLLWHISRSSPTILYCHGNTKHLDHYWARAKLLYMTGYNVFMFDYRGFGKSEGTITEQGMLADAHAALEYLIAEESVSEENILVYGFSIGTVPATELAARSDMAGCLGLVLEAPVGSAEIYAQDATYLPLPANFLTEYDLDNASMIKEVRTRLLWLHGTEDSMNKYDTHGRAVYNNYGGSAKFKKIVEGAKHSDIPRVLGADFSVYVEGIKGFAEGEKPF